MIVKSTTHVCPQCFVEFESCLFDFCSDQCEIQFDRQIGPDSQRFTTDVTATPIDKEDS